MALNLEVIKKHITDNRAVIIALTGKRGLLGSTGEIWRCPSLRIKVENQNPSVWICPKRDHTQMSKWTRQLMQG